VKERMMAIVEDFIFSIGMNRFGKRVSEMRKESNDCEKETNENW